MPRRSSNLNSEDAIGNGIHPSQIPAKLTDPRPLDRWQALTAGTAQALGVSHRHDVIAVLSCACRVLNHRAACAKIRHDHGHDIVVVER